MPYSSQRVDEVLGQSRTDYQCNHVVNHVLNGSKLIGGLAKDYLAYGQPASLPSAGTVVVGEDGVHVGIFVSSDDFIHSSSSQIKVIRVKKSQLQYVFPNGYQFRR